MEALIYFDTHVVAWLYAGERAGLTPAAADRIDRDDDLRISPAVVLELQYLKEIGRLTVGGNAVVRSLAAQLGLRVCDLPFDAVVESALDQHWTRDPFDRLIVAQAAVANAPLLTKDRSIRRHYRQAVW